MQVESLWWPSLRWRLRRLRWRLRGAWQWPTFVALTFVDTAIVALVPFHGDTPDPLGAFLLAGFFNLVVVAALAPVAGFVLRRRRPDLPKLVARDYAGTSLLVLVALGLVAGGIAHRSALARERADRQAVMEGVRQYVVTQAPGYRAGLQAIDAMRVEDDLYRACVPGPDPRRWLCLYVNTDQSPAGIRVDGDRLPNDVGP